MNTFRRKWNDQNEAVKYVDNGDDVDARKRKTMGFNEYAKHSTIHGVKYVGNSQSSPHILLRILWIIILLISLYFCLKFILNVHNRWTDGPVIVGVAERTMPIWDIPFPAVTICPETKSKMDKLNFTENYHKFAEKPFRYPPDNMTEIDAERMEALVQICDDHLTEGFKFNEDISNNRGIVEKLRDIAPTFEEVLVFCKWRNQPDYCHNFFEEIWTEDGLCFSFNNLNSAEIFTDKLDSKYPHFTNNFSSKYWSLENGYDHQARPLDFPAYPHQVYTGGARGGLFALLRLLEKDFEYLCRGPVLGFKLALHSPGDLPKVSTNYFRVPLNQETIITVKPKVLQTSENLRGYNPIERQCYFNGERPLRYFNVYSQTNCELECLANYTMKSCGCVKFSMPRNENTKICGATDIKCYSKAEDALIRALAETDKNDDCFECQCLPACNSVTYETEVSHAAFDWKSLFIAFKNPLEDFDSVHPARLSIFFKENHYTATKRYELFSHTDFIAMCGGLLALFFGASILSVFEIIYHLVLHFFWRSNRNPKVSAINGTENVGGEDGSGGDSKLMPIIDIDN